MCVTCVWHLFDMCLTCVWHVCDMCLTCVWHVFDVCSTCVWRVFEAVRQNSRALQCTTGKWWSRQWGRIVVHFSTLQGSPDGGRQAEGLVYDMCLTCVWRVCDMCMTCVWHVFHMCFTCVSHVFHMCFTCVSHVFHMCSTCVWHVCDVCFRQSGRIVVHFSALQGSGGRGSEAE